MIGTNDTDGGTNTRIYLIGNTYGSGASGNMEYFATSTGSHRFLTTDTGIERMRITSTGNVGIGTNAQGTTDTAKLYVVNSSTAANHLAGTIGIWLYNPTNSAGQNSVICNKIGGPLAGKVIYSWDISSTWGCSIVANGNDTNKMLRFNDTWDGSGVDRMTINNLNGNVVIGGNLNVGSLTNPSDSRIKKDIEDINDATALNKLLLIQPTTYNYIDVERNKGFGKVYGFIAQQIREVIPEAVPIIEYIIPNIYKSCLINNKREVYHRIPLDTPIDTYIKIRGSEYKIKEIYEDYFVIDKDIEDVEAFVYGYNIKDFHTLNKDYIFTLNVCATQELHRRIETQSVLLKSQDDRIKDLETKVATLMSNM
jgi:hypothetical protein